MRRIEKEIGQSPYLNKMSLKISREDDELDMDQKKVKTKENELVRGGTKMSSRLGKGKKKAKTKSQMDMKRNKLIKKRMKGYIQERQNK